MSADTYAYPYSATGVVFSGASSVPTKPLKEDDGSSASSSKTPSILDSEKGHSIFEDEKNLAKYLVPALEKGQKNARLKPPTLWIKFRVWYNPYRMVCICILSH
jgi:hypothetical protein